MKAKFGGGRTTAFALVYDSFDEKKKYDSKTGLKRVSTFFRYSKEGLHYVALAAPVLPTRRGIVMCVGVSVTSSAK